MNFSKNKNYQVLNYSKENELSQDDSMRKIGISDFSTKTTNYYNLDLVNYRLKKHRFIIEELQAHDLNIITDKVYEDLKTISDYIEDNTKFETQRFQMEILKSKGNNGNFLTIKKKIEMINKVLENKYDFSNIKVD